MSYWLQEWNINLLFSEAAQGIPPTFNLPFNFHLQPPVQRGSLRCIPIFKVYPHAPSTSYSERQLKVISPPSTPLSRDYQLAKFSSKCTYSVQHVDMANSSDSWADTTSFTLAFISLLPFDNPEELGATVSVTQFASASKGIGLLCRVSHLPANNQPEIYSS